MNRNPLDLLELIRFQLTVGAGEIGIRPVQDLEDICCDCEADEPIASRSEASSAAVLPLVFRVLHRKPMNTRLMSVLVSPTDTEQPSSLAKDVNFLFFLRTLFIVKLVCLTDPES